MGTIAGTRVLCTHYPARVTKVGSRESQSEGMEERREASAREGWKGGVLEERRFCWTTSK